MTGYMTRCLNWKVLLGAGGVAVLVLIVAPGAGGVIPFLAVLACPLSMVVMMWSMRGSPTSERVAPGSDERIAELEAQIAALRADGSSSAERMPDNVLTR